ncbi:MAG: M48 family metallopeptidase [Bacteroidales bacterium]|nr:M48 family metallopeptidase [Bacteroidales bacterium]
MNKLKYINLILIFVIISCGTVPFSGRKQFTAIPSAQMISLAEDNYAQVLRENEPSGNQQYNDQVKRVGERITSAVEEYFRNQGRQQLLKNYKWEFNVLESEEKNAWCMPGGKIAFYEGIMPICKDDNGVAVVMAHEIAHAVARHGNERMSQQLTVQLGGMVLSEALKEEEEKTRQLAMAAFGVGSQLGILLPYSRTHEREADELGLYFMAMANYDPRGAPEFWKRMQAEGGSGPPEFLSTHPNPENRIQNMEEHMQEALKYYEEN